MARLDPKASKFAQSILEFASFRGKAGKEPLSRAVYVPFYLNKVKDKEEKQVSHTYQLIKAKIFRTATK